LDNGVAIVLVVNPRRKAIIIYLPDQIDDPATLGINDTLILDKLLPGFQLAVKTLFED
jgi:Uma2 family endonuclease